MCGNMKSERWTAVEYEREIKGIHNIIKSTHIEQPYNAMLLCFEYEKENEEKKNTNKSIYTQLTMLYGRQNDGTNRKRGRERERESVPILRNAD